MSACDVRDDGEPGRLAEEVRAAAPTGRSGALVGIDGPGGSGKSTLAAVLAAEIADAVVVHGDDFYRPSADRPRGTAASGGQFDLDRLLRQVVAPAASGGAVRYQRYDWSRDELAEWIPVPGADAVHAAGNGHLAEVAAAQRAAAPSGVACDRFVTLDPGASPRIRTTTPWPALSRARGWLVIGLADRCSQQSSPPGLHLAGRQGR